MKIISVGEALIDFTPHTVPGTYIRNFGGAPANVAVMAASLGADAAFIGKVGKDSFGGFLLDTLNGAGVDTGKAAVTENACTTLAFVHLDERGERSFEFVRNPGADMLLEEADIPEDLCDAGDIVHFGSAQLMYESGERAIEKLIRIAHEKGAQVSFDPNYRSPQWSSASLAKRKIKKFLEKADLVKVSEDEARWLTGEEDYRLALQNMRKITSAVLIMTCGSDGGCYLFDDKAGMVEGYRQQAVDTTGAGDAFWGAFLAVLSESRTALKNRDEEQIRFAIQMGNAAGALCVMQKGALVSDITRKKLRNMIEG